MSSINFLMWRRDVLISDLESAIHGCLRGMESITDIIDDTNIHIAQTIEIIIEVLTVGLRTRPRHNFFMLKNHVAAPTSQSSTSMDLMPSLWSFLQAADENKSRIATIRNQLRLTTSTGLAERYVRTWIKVSLNELSNDIIALHKNRLIEKYYKVDAMMRDENIIAELQGLLGEFWKLNFQLDLRLPSPGKDRLDFLKVKAAEAEGSMNIHFSNMKILLNSQHNAYEGPKTGTFDKIANSERVDKSDVDELFHNDELGIRDWEVLVPLSTQLRLAVYEIMRTLTQIGEPIFDTPKNSAIDNVTAIVEEILECGLKKRRRWTGSYVTSWDYVRGLRVFAHEDTNETVLSLERQSYSCTNRLRAWIRLALISQRLAIHLQLLTNNRNRTEAFYEARSPLCSDRDNIISLLTELDSATVISYYRCIEDM